MGKNGVYEKIYDIKLEDIVVSENNVRHDPDHAIEELAESIKLYGLKQPVMLMGTPGKPKYELIIGQRRFKAHHKLGKKTIRAIFERPMNEIDAMIVSLGENMHRVELNYGDKANAITKLYIHFGRNASETARRTGLSVPTILDYVAIEEQSTEKLKDKLTRREITKTDARRILIASQGKKKKINELIEEFPKLKAYEKDRAVEFGKKNPDAPAGDIIKEGRTPKYKPQIIVELDLTINEALDKAAGALALDREAVGRLAIEKWLKDNNYLG
jgi:ParB/RepB/Spo0J family partition protein